MKARLLLWAVMCSLAGVPFGSAQQLQIAQDGADVIISWEGGGVLQFAPDVTGPWVDDVVATSPHRIPITGARQLFRMFYPNGFQPVYEPPGFAFAEPNAVPAAMGHELSHALGSSGGSFLPEINDEVLCYSGETRRTEVDLQIKGRGLDFIWARHYRSRHGPDSAQGKRWVFSYDVRIQPVGAHVRVFDGSGRSDVYLHQPDDSYAASQFFREGRFDSNGVFHLVFADTGRWEFRPLDSQSAPGRIARIVDRNGNALSFQYDAVGRLATVTDTLNRNIQVAYNLDGWIESVTDFIGRQVRYEYYQDVEVGGSFGDLKSARSPIVTNTPTLNDYPGGKTNRYFYSEGFANEQENHLLRGIIDARGQGSREYVYQHNQSDLDFLRCQVMRLGYPSNLIQFHYLAQTPAAANQFAVQKVIINDRMGNVSEHFFDAGHRLVLLREFTGRADPTQPTTELLNRPMNPLRAMDPAYFERTWEWNADSLLTRVVHPNGNSVSNVYDSTLGTSVPRRARGNLRERQRWPGPLAGDQSVIVEKFSYDPRFGTLDCVGDRAVAEEVWNQPLRGFQVESLMGVTAFPTQLTDPRGSLTLKTYDERGNCTNVVHRIPTISEDFEYNAFGQLTGHVFPDNGSGFQRRDLFLYHTGGPQMGYLHQSVADFGAGGFNQTTTYSYDAVGNVLTVTDPGGHDALFTYNALDQLVHAESRETSVAGGAPFRQTTDYFYDANDNLVRICESNADDLGRLDPGNSYLTVLAEHDILDRPVRICAESGSFDVPRNPPQLDCTGLPASEFITTEYEYDANWNPSLVRFGEASEGRQPANTLRTLYDERDLTFRTIRAEGDPDQSGTQYDYDGNCNLTITYTGLEAVPRVTQFFYDGYNRCTNTVDAMGNASYTKFSPNGIPLRATFYGETNDVVGGLDNIRLHEVTNSLDAMDRVVRQDVAFFDLASGLPIDDGQSTTWVVYSDCSQLLAVTNDNHHASLLGYDRLLRLQRGRDSRSNEVFCLYDANSNLTNVNSVEKSDLGNPDQTFATRYRYDARDRLVQALDNLSNSVHYAYDSRNNLVQTTDQLGVQTRGYYDGQARQIAVVQDLNANGPNPADLADIVVSNVWDDSFRLVQQIDDNTNATTYFYDPLNRLRREQLADGTGTTNSYDAHDNLLTLHDANGNAVSFDYDLLNRVTNKSIVPGPGVAATTTFERYRYDGLSRLMRAEDDDSLVVLAYNSLGSVLHHRLNGQTTSAGYDGLGNTLRCLYPGGRMIGYAYDPLNRIQHGLDAASNVISTYFFLGPDLMERMDYANQSRVDYAYDGLSGIPNPSGDFGVKQRIRTLHTLPANGQIIDDRSYRWDARYNKTARIDQRPTGPAWRHDYEYDAASRMNKAQLTDSLATLLRDTRYSLDGVGNRIAVTNNSSTELYTMDATAPLPADFQVNQYTTGALGTRTYDDNGNLNALNPGARDEVLLRFDYANHLVQWIDPGNSITNSYAYDALGRRTEMVVFNPSLPPQVTRYYYGADWSSHANALQVVEEQDGLGVTLATYMYGGGLDDVMNMQRGGTDYHFHHDDLGNVMAVTDAAGNVVERYEYGDFGEPMFYDGAGSSRVDSAIGNPYLFTGRRYDDETGLYYFRNRYFDPFAGRFITRDPLGTWGDPASAGNGSTYVGNNPWTHTDPLGLAKEKFVRSKPHVNIGTIGPVDDLVSGGGSLRSKKLFVGGLSWNTDSTAASGRRKQSLYFPESMLQEIQQEAVSQANRRYLYFPKMADTGGHEVGHWLGLYHTTAASDGRDFLVWQRNFGPSSDSATHEVGHWLGLYHTFGPGATGDGDVDGRDYLVWQRGGAAAGNGKVDARDYLVWRQHSGSATGDGTHELGHWLGLAPAASGDGVVDAADYTVWRSHQGGNPDRPIIVGAGWNPRLKVRPLQKRVLVMPSAIHPGGFGRGNIQFPASSGVVDAADYALWRRN